MDHDGRDTGNLYLGELDMEDPYYAHQSVRYRVAGEMVRRYRNRYLERVQVRPRELHPISGPLEPCFRHMLGSLARLEDLLTADREITERLGAKDGASLVRREDEYYELLDARCGDIMVERLGSAAMLAANLIVGAWECAGRTALGHPDSPKAATAAVALEAKPAEAPQDKPDAAEKAGSKVEYVGSRNSGVFHRSDCPHVKRISPSNLVHYESAEDAKRQGKRPCHVCLPE